MNKKYFILIISEMVLRATLASIQKRLNCFKEKWSHLRRRCLDSTLDTWMSHNKCKFHQERDIWGYFAREIKYLLVCVLQLTAGNEEEVSGCQLLKGHIYIGDGCIW
jgi:hypothetical protein